MSFADVGSRTDHLRHEFEAIKRQPEIAKDLDCFRPGGELSEIRYIANAHSFHVVSGWMRVLSHTQAKVHMDTANPLPAFSNDCVTCRPLLPRWLRLPMPIRYFLAGLVLRFSRDAARTDPIHAHCASGNGLVAWMSGQKYLIVTYGSEIYLARQRGRIYCWVMRQILQRAERIYVGSSECIKILGEQFGIPAERVYFFHIGYNQQFFQPLDHSKRMQLRCDRQLPTDEPIWVVNRRTHPHYRTREVVQGFLEYCRDGGRGRLVLLCGDNDPDYTASILNLVHAHEYADRVRPVVGLLSQKEIAPWLQLADFSISVPKSDNMSISILESLGCGTTSILTDIEGYSPMKSCRPVRWMTRFESDDFRDMFSSSGKTSAAVNAVYRGECLQFVQSWFSTEDAIRNIAAFSLGELLPENIAGRRVA